MTIIADDLKFFAADYPIDASYGGGRMNGNVVQDGVTNNVLPNVSLSDRATGRVQMRKVYATVVSANADTLLGTQVRIKTGTTDAGTDAVIFATGSQSTTRAAAAAALAVYPFMRTDVIDDNSSPLDSSHLNQFLIEHVTTLVPAVGDLLWIGQPAIGIPGVAETYPIVTAAVVTAVDDQTTNYKITIDRNLVVGAGISVHRQVFSPTAPRACGAAASTATSGTSSIAVDRVFARVVPDMPTYPTSVNLFDSAGLKPLDGLVPIFRVGGSVYIDNGTNHEVATVASIDYTGVLTFTAPLAHSYASGASVTSFLELGDLGANVASSFSQQTWTRVFSDVLIGSPIGANYNRGAGSGISIDNLGGATERWAIIFTSTTAFKLVGEFVGQIATGDTSTDFAPTNPITGQPYFTIDKDGWGTGWGIGNVLRFNTTGARSPFWLSRTVSPSSPGGSDSVTFELRGSV